MRDVIRISLFAACLLAIASVSTGVITKRVIKPNPPNDVPNGHSLTVVPINVASLMGTTVTLLCEVAVPPPTSRIHWWEFASNGQAQMISDNKVILASHPNAPRYSIDLSSPNVFNLEITDINFGDAGTYVCIDGNSGPPNTFSGQAELVVIDDHPNCTSLVPGDGVVMEVQNYTISCEIRYRGNMSPSKTWTGPEPFLSATIPSDEDVFSAVTFTVDRSFDTRAYICHTNFTTPPGVPQGSAENAPEYDYFYQSPQMFVYWGPKNVYAVPIRPSYQVGDIITCYADAFPPPFYQWQNMRTLEIFSSQSYNITQADIGHNNTLRCQAQNLIQGFLYSAVLFIHADVPVITTPTTTPTTTTPPAEGPCLNLTGWWRSMSPYAELHLRIPADQTGQVLGFMRNHTDQQWVEVVGRTQLDTYSYVGISAIWPYEVGVTGFAGECHRCHGVEILHCGGLWRSYYQAEQCSGGSISAPNVLYEFQRAAGELHDIHHPNFKVHNPTRHVSGYYGIKHLKYD